jgi:hypothetical protein
LTINSSASGGGHAAYLFNWRSHLFPKDAYYYSAWYYIPSNVKPKVWWNVMQWKSTQSGGSSEPIYVIDIGDYGGKLRLYLSYKPNKSVARVYEHNVVDVPTDQWFQIEAYYKRSQTNTGQIVIWQDGVEILRVSNTDTVLSDNTIHWSVNNYTDDIEPNPLTIYVDDAAMSETRLGPGYSYP